MIYILLSILSSTGILILFRYFKKFEIPLYPAIVANYLVAGSLGFIIDSDQIISVLKGYSNWLPYSLSIGFLFITLFNLMGLSSQKAGVGITSVAVKLSMVIPVLGAIYLLNEPVGLVKIMALVLAVASVWLIQPKRSGLKDKRAIFLPLILFLGSGLLDLLLNQVESRYLGTEDLLVFTSVLFGTAGIFGLISLPVFLKKNPVKIGSKVGLAGLGLGLVNFGSIYFLLGALSGKGVPGSVLFPLNNLGIVLLSGLLGWVIFGESLSLRQKIGFALAIIALSLLIGKV